MSEKNKAPRARSRGVSLILSLLPERGLTMVLVKTGGAETLSGSVENVRTELYNCAIICFSSKIIFTKQQYRSHSWP